MKHFLRTAAILAIVVFIGSYWWRGFRGKRSMHQIQDLQRQVHEQQEEIKEIHGQIQTIWYYMDGVPHVYVEGDKTIVLLRNHIYEFPKDKWKKFYSATDVYEAGNGLDSGR